MRHEDREIIFVGGNQLQNELMGDFLGRELGSQCVLAEVLHSIAERRVSRCSKQRLILIDCARMDTAQLSAMFHSRPWQMLDFDYRVLFNLTDGAGIEKIALNFGVRGFFYLREGVGSLLKGVRAIFHEEVWISRKELVDCVLSGRQHTSKTPRLLPGLSFRETEILELLAEGCSNKVIADRLCLSLYTVKSHLNHIFRKINVSSRLQAVHWREHLPAPMP